jgi:tetratricopeptide (TPR) repeat protein
MSKKGKRKKGNTSGASRPSLPDISRASGAPPRAAVAAPPAASTATGAAANANPAVTARAPGHASELLVGTTSESSAAEALAAAPVPSEVPPRDDHQEESGPRIVAFAPTRDEKDEKTEKTEKSGKKAEKSDKSEKKAEKADNVAGGDKPAAKAEKPANKKQSIPPSVELEHERFFAEGEKADKEHRAVARGVIPHEPPEEDPRAKHKMSPAVRERRARFTKYVKWTVGASAIVCLAALANLARGQHGTENLGGSQAAEISQSPMPAPAPPPAPEPTPVQAAAPTPPPVPDTQAAAPAPAPTDTTPPAPAAATTAAAAPATEITPDPAAAKEEKLAAKKALERGDMKGAIEAGERSVALDPTDGDAWLLLGAAYQEKGKGADARRAFTGCVKQGKRGAISECAAMLR